MHQYSRANRVDQALLASKNSVDEHLQKILSCTKGILFLGTPHSGAGLARWAEMMAKSIGFIKQTNSQIIEVLRSESEVLERIQTDFHTMLRGRAKNDDGPIEITCFFEELPLPGVGIVRSSGSDRVFRMTEMTHPCPTRLFPCNLLSCLHTHP